MKPLSKEDKMKMKAEKEKRQKKRENAEKMEREEREEEDEDDDEDDAFNDNCTGMLFNPLSDCTFQYDRKYDKWVVIDTVLVKKKDEKAVLR